MASLRRPVAGLPPIAVRGAALGGLYTHVDDRNAMAVVQLALVSGMTYIDTAPLYGHGISESRIGLALRAVPRFTYTVSTKVGRLIEPASPELE